MKDDTCIRDTEWRTFQAEGTAPVKEDLRQEVELPILTWPWPLFNCLVGLDQVHSTLFLLCHHLGWRSWLQELGFFSMHSDPFILRLKPANQVGHLQWTLAMRGVVNAGMPPAWPSLHDCRIHQFPLSPPWYECYSQTTFSYQSYFKSRQFWNAIPCSELLRFLLKLQCHSTSSPAQSCFLLSSSTGSGPKSVPAHHVASRGLPPRDPPCNSWKGPESRMRRLCLSVPHPGCVILDQSQYVQLGLVLGTMPITQKEGMHLSVCWFRQWMELSMYMFLKPILLLIIII